MPEHSDDGRHVPALEVRGLTKRYDDGTLALDDLELEVPQGSFFGLLGPNGAGKTTLISAACNLIRVTEGELRVFGMPAHCLDARRQVGISEQEPNLDRFLSVRETLVYHGGYYGMERAEAEVAAVVDQRLAHGQEAVEVRILLGDPDHPPRLK